jgi:hypothetical protein
MGSENRRLKAERGAEVCLDLPKLAGDGREFFTDGHVTPATVYAVARKCTISYPCQYSS